MVKQFEFSLGSARKALELEDYYIWDCSVINAEGQYHMFSSRWPKEYGFGWNWLFNSEIIHSVSDTPEGPYRFSNVVLKRRSREYFDGMNTHNTCIRYYSGKYYLYYMGCTYDGEPPTDMNEIDEERAEEVWNKKRIGLAVADSINGEFIRSDKPLLEPRDSSHWDCTVTTNPSVAILPDGKTYMIYKSRSKRGGTLKLGLAYAEHPEGPFKRLCDEPLFRFDDPNLHIEDPTLWYDEARRKFCLIAKDDSHNGSLGITGEWGSGFYAESDDCVNFEIADPPTVYTRQCHWQDGHESVQNNLERCSLLFDEAGTPAYMFFASGDGPRPYIFDKTYIICNKLYKKQKEGQL